MKFTQCDTLNQKKINIFFPLIQPFIDSNPLSKKPRMTENRTLNLRVPVDPSVYGHGGSLLNFT